MSLGGIRKETGRATYDEILRLRQRLDIVEGFRTSLTQSLVATGSTYGPVGSLSTLSADTRYLRLDASNDPLTGSLECLAVTLNSGDLNISAGNEIITAGNLSLSAGGITVVNAAKGLDVLVTTTDSAVNINVHGSEPDTLSPDAATNAANNLLMWFEADQLSTFSDGADITDWYNMGLGATANFQQTVAAKKPHFKTSQTPLGKPGLLADTATDQHFQKVAGGNDFRFGNDGASDSNFGVIVVYRTDAAAASNNILVLGNSGTASKQSFRPVGNSALGNSYCYTPTNSLVMVGTGHPGHSGGTWHIALFFYTGSTDATRVWIDGTEYSAGSTTDLDIVIDMVMRDINSGGQEGVALGTGVAAIVGFGYQGTGAQPDLTEMQQVHDFIALEYMGDSYTIGSGNTAGDILTLQNTSVTKSVFDLNGKLHIGGTDPQQELDVQGDADVSGTLSAGVLSISSFAAITGQVTAGSLSVTGLSTLSGVSAGAASVATLAVSGLATCSATLTANAIVCQNKLFIGSSSSLVYSGSNLVFNPKELGSGHVLISGTLEKQEAVLTKSADYTLEPEDNFVLADTDGVVITLSPPASLAKHTIKHIAAAPATIYIIGNSGETIDGYTTLTVSTRMEAVKVVTDGTNWYIV